ncbi:MAG TPA: hypothetical protein VN870_06490 [Streptosporangiaceae bacterium]|nr:hypothetical protein [Streptosporangiaceae bacterium]
MGLKPEASFGATLAVMGLDYGIFQLHLPSVSDVKNSPPHNSILGSGTNAAAWTAVSACAALSLLARDPNIFIFGGGFAVALTWFYKHANMTHPGLGEVTMPPAGGAVPGGVS